MELQNIERPRVVYKYHSINSYFYNLLENGNVWFSHQNDLNDPFDCKYALSDKYLNELLIDSCQGVLADLKRGNPLFNGISDDKFKEIIMPELKTNEWLNGFYNMLFGQGMGWNVCCFTTNPVNELMWAHYANNNKGVCLEFDLSKSNELFEKLQPVTYDNTFPEIDSADDLITALLTKRKVWNYEEEWRILSNVGGIKPFNKNSLIGIYFGFYVTESEIDKVKKTMVASGYTECAFKQVNLRIKGVPFKQMDQNQDFDFRNEITP